jgi:hypothetical protein
VTVRHLSVIDIGYTEKLFEVLPLETLLLLFMEAKRLDCKVVIYLVKMCKKFFRVVVNVMRELCCEFLREAKAIEVDSLVASWIWHHLEGE